jgi:two-component system, sensor histidine kinase PdtaS
MTLAQRFAHLPTTGKFLIILTAVLLPIGIALTLLGELGIRQANAALLGRSNDQARVAADAIEGLIARNALALRVAAAGALRSPGANPCDDTAQALATAPAITRRFSLRSTTGELICTYGDFAPKDPNPLAAPGDIRASVDPDANEVAIRVGVVGGMVTASVPRQELRNAALAGSSGARSISLRDRRAEMSIVDDNQSSDRNLTFTDWPISNGALVARIGVFYERITPIDRLMLLLPVLMWIAAALLTWFLVNRLLVRPLRRLERAVVAYQPGGPLDLPRKLGPSEEIQQLRDAFARAVARVEESDAEMTDALEGQRRLVREVHHRVKNNLQVVASLLNIHGRSATTTDARAAYAGISRRVGALSIVHRNHFAEMEENRGIALRPLMTELAAELRAGAPDAARGLKVDLEIESLNTTQDVAVAVAFLITEIVEFAMLHSPTEPIEISLRRTSELTARLVLGSSVLVPNDEEDAEKVQFERIVGGLAKQLRSTLDRKLGRYSVDLPVFPRS